MCRNHSHVTGRIFSMQDEGDVTTVRMLVVQPLTVETSTGAKLTLPAYCVLSVRLPERDASLVKELLPMVAQGASVSLKDEQPATSGPTP